MAVEIEGRTLPKRPSYDWAPKMNGSYWQLVRGVDFPAEADIENVRQAAINYVARWNKKAIASGGHQLMLNTTKEDEDTLGVIGTVVP
jgi:hypothetical protein